MRLVPKQDPDKCVAAFRGWVEQNTPKGIQTEVRVLSAGPAIVGESGSSRNSDRRARPSARCSGSRPFSFAAAAPSRSWANSPRHLGIPTVLMGFGLPDDGLHSPNEKYRISNYYQGIDDYRPLP